MDFEGALDRMLRLAKENGGTVKAVQVESDPELAANRSTVSAAAHKLAGATNVFAVAEESQSEEHWFPYAEIVFTELRG